jgi:hypothetical protein
MGRDHFCDFQFQLPKVTGKRPPHLGGTGVDCDPVINDRREQFPEQQRDGRWAASHSETESCACRPASQRGCGTSGQK